MVSRSSQLEKSRAWFGLLRKAISLAAGDGDLCKQLADGEKRRHGHDTLGLIACMPEILIDAKCCFRSSQQRIVIIRRVVHQAASAMVCDDNGRNSAASIVGRAPRLVTAAP